MRFKTLVALSVCGVLALTGCTKPGPAPSVAKSTLSIGAYIEPPTLDPTTNASAAIAQALLYNVYETLVKIDGEGNIQPLLATKYALSEDRKTYTFSLKNDAVFASGSQVKAHDVKRSLDRIKTVAEINPALKMQFEPVESIEAPDDGTVLIKLTRPSNSWLYAMAGQAGIVIDGSAPDLKTATAGSGPYKLKQWRKGDALVLEKSTNHAGKVANFNEVAFRYFTDPTAANSALLSADLDVISNLQSPQSLNQFADPARFAVQSGTTNAEVVLGLNNAQAPFNDLRLRKAVVLGIDRKTLLNTVWAGQGTLIGSMVPPTDPWYEDLANAQPYDKEKAKALVQESGFQGTIRLRVPTLAYATSSAQFIASALKEIGLTVNVEQLDWSTWLNSVHTGGDYDMTIVAHVEPRDIVKFAKKDYYWHYDNAEFAQLVTEADSADKEKSVEIMKKAAKKLNDDCAADFLWLLPNLVVTKTGVRGIDKNYASLSFDLSNVTANS